MGSRGSVIPFFLQQAKSGLLPITSPEMTRFNISLSDGVAMVKWAISNAQGGEIFVPKIPSYRIMDLANAISPSAEKPIVGLRPGEKIHEEMITMSDSHSTVELGEYYAILQNRDICNTYLRSRPSACFVPTNFEYNSEGILSSLLRIS